MKSFYLRSSYIGPYQELYEEDHMVHVTRKICLPPGGIAYPNSWFSKKIIYKKLKILKKL